MTSTRPRSLSRQAVKHPPPSFPRTAQVAEPAVEGAWSEEVRRGASSEEAHRAWPWAHEGDAASLHETARETHEREKARAPGADAGDAAWAHHERDPASSHPASSSSNMQRKMEGVAPTPKASCKGFRPPMRDIAPKRALDGSLATGEQDSLGEQESLASERRGTDTSTAASERPGSLAPRQQQSLWSGEHDNKAHQLTQGTVK